MKKPIGVYIIGIIGIVVTSLIFLITPLLLAFIFAVFEEIPILLVSTIIFSLIINTIRFIVSIGLLRFKRWGCHMTIVLSVIAIVVGPLNILIHLLSINTNWFSVIGQIVSIVYNLIVLAYLRQRRIKKFFKK